MTDEEMNEYLQKQFGNIWNINTYTPTAEQRSNAMDEGMGASYSVDPALQRKTEFGPGISNVRAATFGENRDPLATEYGVIPSEQTATPTSYRADLTAPDKDGWYYTADFSPDGEMIGSPKREKYTPDFMRKHGFELGMALVGGAAFLPMAFSGAGAAGAGAGVGAGATGAGVTAAEAAMMGYGSELASLVGAAEATGAAGALGAGAAGELGAGAISEAALGELGINTALTASDLAANTGLAEVLASTNSQAALGELGINTNGGLFNSISQFGNTLSQIPRNIGTFFLPEAPAGVQTALGNLITNTALNGGDIEAAAKGSLFSSLGSLAGPLGAQLAPGLDRTVQDYLGKFIINTVQSGGDVEKALKSLATSALTGKVTELTGLPKEVSGALIQAARTGNFDPTRIATTLATNYLKSPPRKLASGGLTNSSTDTAMDDFFNQGYYDDSNARFNQRYQRFDVGGWVSGDDLIDSGGGDDVGSVGFFDEEGLNDIDTVVGGVSDVEDAEAGSPDVIADGGNATGTGAAGNTRSAADNNPLVDAIAKSFGISPAAAKLALSGISAAAGAALLPATINKGMTPTGLQALPTEGLKGPATQQVATGATGTGGRGSVRHFATVPVGTAAPAPVGPPKVYGRTGIEYASPEAARAAGEFNFTLNRPVGVPPPAPAPAPAPGPAPAPAPAPGPNYGDLITSAYGNVGRTGVGADPNQIDQAGYDYWMQQFQAGNVTPETFNNIFTQANNRNLVTSAYEDVGRTGIGTDPNQIDQAGFDWWMQQLQSGNETPATIAENLKTAAQRDQGVGSVNAAVIVYGPDGTQYSDPGAAMRAGVTNYTSTPPAGLSGYDTSIRAFDDSTNPENFTGLIDPRESDPRGFGYDPNAVQEFARGGGISDVVYGPDGTAYKSEAQARSSGVTDVMSARSRMRPMRSNFGMRPSTSMGDYTGGDVAKARGGAINQGLGYLRSAEDGMADRIEAVIDNRQPAKLSGGEFVIPADVVSHLGNGNSDAGAKQLHDFMSRIRKARTGNPKQGRQITPTKYLPK